MATAVLNRIARREGIDTESVYKEIEYAMEIGMNNTDPNVRAMWSSIPCKGDKPTVDELIVWILSQIA